MFSFLSFSVQLAVYGTLKRNHVNHWRLQEKKAHFIGQGMTEPTFDMLDIGHAPGLVSGKSAIPVEVYKIRKSSLAFLDRFEGCPDVYQRITVPIAQYGDCELYILSDVNHLTFMNLPAMKPPVWIKTEQI